MTTQPSQPAVASQRPADSQVRADQRYETEEHVHKASMMDVDYKYTLVSLVSEGSFSQRCKMALYALINMAFDKNSVLAFNSDIDLRMLRFEEAMNKTKLSFTRPDVMNPDVVYIMENLRQNFRDYISRSKDGGERRMQGERKQVVTSEYRQSVQQDQQEKRGFNISAFDEFRGGNF